MTAQYIVCVVYVIASYVCKLMNNIYSILKGQKGENGRPGIPGPQVFFFMENEIMNHIVNPLREGYLQIKMGGEKGRCSLHSKCILSAQG